MWPAVPRMTCFTLLPPTHGADRIMGGSRPGSQPREKYLPEGLTFPIMPLPATRSLFQIPVEGVLRSIQHGKRHTTESRNGHPLQRGPLPGHEITPHHSGELARDGADNLA